MTTADDLLRPTGQPPSHEEMRGVTVEASIQADKDWQGAWTSTPPSMTEAEHYLTSRRAALENAAQDIYLGAIENASPDQRDSLLQNLHRQHITLTEWATAQAAPILSQNERTALRRDYRTLQRVPHHHQGRRPVDRPRNRRQSPARNRRRQRLPRKRITGSGRRYHPQRTPLIRRRVLPPNPNVPHNLRQHAPGHRHPGALHPERDILWSWPGNHVKYTHKTLAHFTGRFLVYIGEDQHGHTGSQKFHQILETDYTEKDSFKIPTFPGLQDRIVLYERAGHPQAAA